MGNSSSKSDKKQKKEEPSPTLVPLERPLTSAPAPPRLVTSSDPKRRLMDTGPPVACAAVSHRYVGAPAPSRVTPAPALAPSMGSFTTTATRTPPPPIDASIPSLPEKDFHEMAILGPPVACACPPPQFDLPPIPFSLLVAPEIEPPKPLPVSTSSVPEPTPTPILTDTAPEVKPKKGKKDPKRFSPIDRPKDRGFRMACKTVQPKWERELEELKTAYLLTDLDSTVPEYVAPTTTQDSQTLPTEHWLTTPPEPGSRFKIKSKPASPYSDSLLIRDDSAVSLDSSNFANLSIDLFPVAKHLFRFLEAIDEVPRDPIKNLMAFALHRYNKWLDFINWCIETGQDDIDHRPPFDIEVVWVAHVIRTDEYKSDCLRLFGREIPHVFDHKSGAHTSVSETTRKLWKERTGSDLVMNTEKFFNLASVFASNLASGTISDQNKTSITVCILIEDMKWFHDFRDFYPRSLVSLLSNTPSPITSSSSASEEEEIQQNLKREFGAKETPLDLEISESDKTFLEEAHRDYLRFLALQKKYNFTRGPESEEGAGKVCATYKIDLFWHSHMLNTREYRRDCESYLGDIVPHAPWPTEAVESLNNKFNFTGDLWQREFGDEFQATKP